MWKYSSYSSICVCKASHLLLCGTALQLPKPGFPFPEQLTSLGFWETNSTQPPPNDFRYIFPIFDQFSIFFWESRGRHFLGSVRGAKRGFPSSWGSLANSPSGTHAAAFARWDLALPVAITAVSSPTTHKQMTSRLLFSPGRGESERIKHHLFFFTATHGGDNLMWVCRNVLFLSHPFLSKGFNTARSRLSSAPRCITEGTRCVTLHSVRSKERGEYVCYSQATLAESCLCFIYTL